MRSILPFVPALCAALLIPAVLPMPLLASEIASPASAPGQLQSVTDAEIQARLDRTTSDEDADRAAVRDLLARPEVRRVAGSAGIDLRRAQDGVASLSGERLREVASQARDIQSRIGGEMNISWPLWIAIIVVLVVIIAAL